MKKYYSSIDTNHSSSFRLLLLGLASVALLALYALGLNALTQTPIRQNESTSKTLSVVFQGGNVSENVMSTLLVLNERGLLTFKSGKAENRESLESLYIKALELPGPSPLIAKLARSVNQNIPRQGDIQPGEQIRYPKINLETFHVVRTYNLSFRDDQFKLEQTRKLWAGYIEKDVVLSPGIIELILTAYNMDLSIESPEKLNLAIDQLRLFSSTSVLPSAHVRVLTPKAPIGRAATIFNIRLEGGDIASDAMQVIRTLVSLGLVNLASHKVEAGDTVEIIYKKRLGIPISMTKLAEELNRVSYKQGKHLLRIGDRVLYPDIRFSEYQWTKILNLKIDEDRQELDNIRIHWKHVIREKPSILSNDLVQVDLVGYDLKINAGSKEKLDEARTVLQKSLSKNIVFLFPSGERGKANYYSCQEVPMVESAKTWWQDCCAILPQTMEKGRQGYLGCYVNLTAICETYEILRNCSSETCPEIILLDKFVYSHPDIAEALIDENGDGISAPPLLNEGKQRIEYSAFGEADHGTHLAGIIASRDNGFGLIGINPRAGIYRVDWEEMKNGDPDKLPDFIQGRKGRGQFQIFTFASDMEFKVGGDERFQNGTAKKIMETKNHLWITAAGQRDVNAGKNMRNISIHDNIGPMNLGDLPNVIVVTACDGCYDTDVPYLTPGANYSKEGLVHLAAPGEQIPSTISNDKYAKMGGTSQATALVTGIASLMVSGYPAYYNNAPEKVKFRLQVTSRPVLKDDDNDRVAAGILDAPTALLNPNNDLIEFNSNGKKAFQPKHWCIDALSFKESGSPIKPINPKTIYRLFRRPDGYWIIYTSQDVDKGVITKLGPGTILNKTQPLFATKDHEYKQDEFIDLLLSNKGIQSIKKCSASSLPQ